MYNNLESETLILKRLESALANEDNDLLKIAAYKLHEKFHSGYKFEYIKQLKSVYDYVYDNPVFNEEIAHLVTSTIEDIINQKDEPKKEDVTSVIDNILPSSNVFKSYSEEYKPEPKTEIQQSLFNNFIQGNIQETQEEKVEEYNLEEQVPEPIEEVHSSAQEEQIQEQEIATEQETALGTTPELETTFGVASKQEIDTEPEITSEQEITTEQETTLGTTPELETTFGVATKQEIDTEPETTFGVASKSETVSEVVPEPEITPAEEKHISKRKNICLFLGEKNSDIDEKFIKDFIKTLNKDEALSKELGELQTFINIAEQELGSIDKIIEPIKNTAEKLFVITDSINGKILDVLKSCNIENSENFDFYPLCGLTRVLECSDCDEKYTNYSNLQILSAICPVCGSYMLPNIETPKKCNIVEFEKALLALFKSEIWVLVNPPKEDKKEFVNMFKMASRLKRPEIIYILTQDENKKVLWKELFDNTGIEVRTNYSNTESFLNDFLGE